MWGSWGLTDVARARRASASSAARVPSTVASFACIEVWRLGFHERKQRCKTMKYDYSPIEVYIRYELPGTGETQYAHAYAKEHYQESV